MTNNSTSTAPLAPPIGGFQTIDWAIYSDLLARLEVGRERGVLVLERRPRVG